MKIMYHMKWPVFVFYTEKFVPMGGITYTFGPLCVILIKPKYKDDEGILNHQMVHVNQHWRMTWLHRAKYKKSDKYRFESEAEAYAAQYGSNPDKKHFDLFVEFMLEKYKLPFAQRTIEGGLLRMIKELDIPAPV